MTIPEIQNNNKRGNRRNGFLRLAGCFLPSLSIFTGATVGVALSPESPVTGAAIGALTPIFLAVGLIYANSRIDNSNIN
ncbi:hypothetical protein KC675_03645 [Candidatus Dojkabacteria bacterium]|uniref:Uncharacterized protein n=1 Tax=Candidatus Dojkabacteria bacterium TaxID=2099670 RepID=A0A955I7X8_9BACT|nr:hypothetical protein [Candidatus Dojkabacteria bacterium]